jgi:hemerythrin-like metal-binding protein
MMKKTSDNDWSAKYMVDIPSIDRQHSGFFDLVNRTMKKQRTSPVLSKEDIDEIIKHLEDYLTFHFAHEEKLMREAGYDKLEQHVTEHRYFINKIEEYKIEQSFNSPLLFDKLLEFMKKWFLAHIIKSDYLYKEDIKKLTR